MVSVDHLDEDYPMTVDFLDDVNTEVNIDTLTGEWANI